MRSVLTKTITIEEVIDKIESRLHEIDLLEADMRLTRQELSVVQGRIEISWQMVILRVAELRDLVANLKEFISHGGNDGESEE